MNEAKEFQGKNLDEAIEAACKYFDLKRDKLEIEIISGGSSGIFGLVGVKKAIVRAKPRGSLKLAEPERSARAERAETRRPAPDERAAARDAEGEGDENAPEPRPARSESSRRSPHRGRGRSERDGNRAETATPEANGNRVEQLAPDIDGNRIEQSAPDIEGNCIDFRPPREGNRRRRPRREAERSERPRREPRETPRRPAEPAPARAPQVPFSELDQEKLVAVAREVTQNLTLPLVENAQIDVKLQNDRVLVRIDDPENSGLLIGREGQTLAAIQYLVNRLVSKRMDASVRVQIDAGDYRENQDERLRQLARRLADKVVATGRTQSTRPMSSYHRRVVHLALQDDEFVFTRSKGEGAMKRVLIMLKRKDEATGEGVVAPQDAPARPEAAPAAPAADPKASMPEAPAPEATTPETPSETAVATEQASTPQAAPARNDSPAGE